MPPWPGMSRPESLTLALRFMADSQRSPSGAATPITKPNQAVSLRLSGSKNQAWQANAAATDPSSPPTAPSQGFFGLMARAKGGRPSREPTEKAGGSLGHVPRDRKKNRN